MYYKSFKELYLGNFTVNSGYSKAVDCLVDYYKKTESMNNKDAFIEWKKTKEKCMIDYGLSLESLNNAKLEASGRFR